MSEAQQSNQPVFSIEKVYVKDLSLEIPNAPQIFLEREAPQVDIQLHHNSNAIEDGVYQTMLTVTVTAKVGEKTLFLVEATQAGIFVARNIPTGELDAVYRRLRPALLRLANLLTGSEARAEDVVHDAFVAVVERADQYRAERGSVVAWLVATVATQSVSVLGSLLAPRFADPAPVLFFTPAVAPSGLSIGEIAFIVLLASRMDNPVEGLALSAVLGDAFDVRASVGHVADLPSKGLAVDVDNGFKPTYELTERGKQVVKDLKVATTLSSDGVKVVTSGTLSISRSRMTAVVSWAI